MTTTRVLQCGERTLSLEHPRVMGILNVTPDSFSDGGRFAAGARAVDPGLVLSTAEEMVAAGAAIVDVGGESTRPGAQPVSEDDECRRVLPVVETLRRLDVIVSVDTAKAGVARRAIDLGCHIVNDVSGLADPAMLPLLARSDVGVVIMHMLGEPRSMQQDPHYEDVIREVAAYLSERVDRCLAGGIGPSRLCVDPGFGFGKTFAHNLLLLQGLGMVNNTPAALMVGLSRKRMIGELTGRPVSHRQAGSVAAAVLAVQRGADIVRVHDVAATVDALAVLRGVCSS